MPAAVFHGIPVAQRPGNMLGAETSSLLNAVSKYPTTYG